MKRQLCRLAEQGFDIFRILQTRQLNDNAVGSLALNDRFFGAQFVNAAADNLNRLVDDFQAQLVQSRFAVFDDQRTVLILFNQNAVVYFLKQAARLIAGIQVFDFYFDRFGTGVQILIADFVLAQKLARGIFNH